MQRQPSNFSPASRSAKNLCIDSRIVHVNSLRMNIIYPLLAKALRLLETKLSPYFRQPPVIRRPIQEQLEFPWLTKR
jgi:hypothetical protein